jgi:hypothetical protein
LKIEEGEKLFFYRILFYVCHICLYEVLNRVCFDT